MLGKCGFTTLNCKNVIQNQPCSKQKTSNGMNTYYPYEDSVILQGW